MYAYLWHGKIMCHLTSSRKKLTSCILCEPKDISMYRLTDDIINAKTKSNSKPLPIELFSYEQMKSADLHFSATTFPK